MIENIRKYNGLVILGIVVVALALVIGLQDSNVRGLSGGQAYLKIAGKTYSGQEYQKYGSNSIEVIQSLAQASRDFTLYQFLIGLTTSAQTQEDQAEQFFIGRMLIREAKDKFGVRCGEDEITNYIKNIRAFAGEDQSFDPKAYQLFIERGMGPLGMTDKDLRELISDIIAYNKINAIIGAGLGPNREATLHNLALNEQSISGEIGRIEIAPFEESIEPTDQELKAYWELIQDSFKTEPLRKFTYVIATPDMPADETAVVEDEKKDTIVEAAMTDEAKAAAEKAKADAKAKKETELAEARHNAQLKIDALIDDFSYDLEEKKGEGFEELAAKKNLEVKTTEFFAKSTPPAELDINLRSSSEDGRAVDELFKMVITTDPISKISQPIPVGDNQWLVARLDAEEMSRVKTFEEAQTDVLKQYISEKSAEALRAAADKAAEEIRAALAGGKSFAAAAKAAGIKEVSSFEDFTQSSQAKPYIQPRGLFDVARGVDPKSLADPFTEPSSAYLVYVSERTWTKGESADDDLEMQIASSTRQNTDIAFTSWLRSNIEAANVERLYQQ